MSSSEKKIYNTEFVYFLNHLSTKILSEWNTLEEKKQNQYKSTAYKKAAQTISNIKEPITHPQQLSSVKNIGKSILEKLTDFYHLGSSPSYETTPYDLFTNIYGVGTVKAKELVSKGFTTIQQLRENIATAEFNEKQLIGLQYYEPLLERIPRGEIILYECRLRKLGIKFEIVGSYRRGATHSGDIDIIITSSISSEFNKMLNTLIREKIIIEVLAKGPSKCLAISQLSPDHLPRRIDFLFTSAEEYPFAILYFTGSKEFNTFFRSFANEKGYSINEHTIISTTNQKITYSFKNEEDIFTFIGLDYVEPNQRNHLDIVKKNIKNHEIIHLIRTNSVFEHFTEEELFSAIEWIDQIYYHSSQESKLTDLEYDFFFDYLKNTYPKNSYFHSIGAKPPSSSNKVKLPIYMGSMNKILTTKPLLQWIDKYRGPYLISCKLDGVSGLYVKNVDGTEKLYTRGNGEYGQDISHLIPYLHLPKNKSKNEIMIRGEFIMENQTFQEKYAHQYSNARNFTSGIINRNEVDNSIHDIHFIPYEVISPSFKPYEQFQFLIQNKYRVVHHFFVDTISENLLNENLVSLRKEYRYQIDGLIITNNEMYERKPENPDHSFAFKINSTDQMVDAVVEDVLWTPSKDGYLKPRIQIQPISINNVTITYLNGFNAAYIQQNKIGASSVLRIMRSGDVIPHIVEILSHAKEPIMPPPTTLYHWTKSGIDIIVDNVEENEIVRLKQITLFFRKLGVEDFSEKYIQRVIDAGYDSIPKIKKMTIQEFSLIQGFQEKLANKIYTHIQEQFRQSTLIQLMDASNIFPRGFSKCKIQSIMDQSPHLLTENNPDSLIQSLSQIKGLSIQSVTLFIHQIPTFLQFLKEIDFDIASHQPTQNQIQTHILSGKNIVMTGFRDVVLSKQIEDVGGILSNTVNQKTFVVICKDTTATNKKLVDAEKNKVPIMKMNEFIQTYINNSI
jgi:DNA ligase (NAD+)